MKRFGVRQHARPESIPSVLLQPVASSNNATPHNARHRRAQEFRTVFASVPKLFSAARAESPMFTRDFETCDGSENRCLAKAWS